MIHPQRVAFWCPEPYRAAMDHALARLDKRIVAEIYPEEEASRGLPAKLEATQPCVVFWRGLADNLTDHLARSVAGGTVVDPPVVAALADWQNSAETLLGAFARSRRHLTLLPAAALLGPPEALAQVLADRLDLPRGPEAVAWPPAAAGDTAPETGILPPGQSAEAALMATAVLQTSPAAMRLLGQLEAASLPVPGAGNPTAPPDVAGLIAGLSGVARSPIPDLRAELARAETEVALLREALSAQEQALSVQRKLADDARAAQDRLTADRAELSARLDRQEAEARRRADDLAAASQAIARATAAQEAEAEKVRRLEERLIQGEAHRASLEAAVAMLETERTALETQGRALEAEVATLVAEARQRADLIRRQREELQAETGRRAEAEAAVAALLASTSWRITAPLRHLVLALRRLRGTG